MATEIGPREVSFLARNIDTGASVVLEDSDLDTRHTPWSTFKIPNLLIGLETGVETSLDAARVWDQDRRPAAVWWPASWRQDQTLRSAFARSAFWYFQDIADDVGAAQYRETLDRWDYGNAEVADGSVDFWLDATLQISIAEQVTWLERVLRGETDLSERSIAALVEVSLADTSGTATLHGKTGGGFRDDRSAEGWYVGFVQNDGRPETVFALHTHGPDWNSINRFRSEFSQRLLRHAGLWPA
ncbi:penicillin-binding transpeptidase domain-containing protein [Gymnodinialimonas sp. 2305UL16-5]|uniref:penicillin-binding transpeptidase domain-containing protein n=1 Tax=Gymnodinialimonas mytili TaxID=3126503 RepID=UPI00309E84B2